MQWSMDGERDVCVYWERKTGSSWAEQIHLELHLEKRLEMCGVRKTGSSWAGH